MVFRLPLILYSYRHMVLPSPRNSSLRQSFPVLLSSTMQSSRGPPPHGSTPSPTDRSNTHTAVPGSFHSSESVPSPSHFFAMDPRADQRLTGPPSMMPYHPLSHTSTYQDNLSWQYAPPWDTSLLDPAAEHPPPTAHGMVSPSHEGNTFVPPIPPSRAVQSRFLSAPHAPPFPPSPTSTSPSDPRESSFQFSANASSI
ncbi:hypothetical protein BC827DRAFT_264869 [Russula dissimulans]|nr:hypothetical protein BC827DRAFT_264869 [Russula dissimulans]